MPCPYSRDLRWRAIWMKEIMGFWVDKVAAALWMSPRTIERYVSKVLNSGDVKAGIIGRSANSVAMHLHVEFLIMEAVLEHPEKSLGEIVYSVYAQTGSEFPLASIFYYLQRNHFSRKKVCLIFSSALEISYSFWNKQIAAFFSQIRWTRLLSKGVKTQGLPLECLCFGFRNVRVHRWERVCKY